VKNLVDSYLKDTEAFSAMLQERLFGEVAYDIAVVGELREGLSIKKALKLADEKYPTETRIIHYTSDEICRESKKTRL
jgi:hypothetical protein